MAFFKFRLPGREAGKAATQAPAESVDSLRRRARHRLIGAAVLVLIGVVGFPLLFDTQPRPVAVDIPIEIPDKAQAKPLAAPPAAVATAPSSASSASESSTTRPVSAKPPAAEEVADAAARAAPPTAAPRPPEVRAVEPREPARTASPSPSSAQAIPKPTPSTVLDEGARARALLEGGRAAATPAAAPASVTPPGTSNAASAENGRFVVQVGAFSDESKAREARMKVERAGLKTYTQVVDTKDGKRIRVRVGPFNGRADADKAANRIKGLDLPAAILTL